MPALICAEEVAYNEIKSRILDGSLIPGSRLVHRTLAKELGMSPNPVVLALRMLERDGLVVNTPGLGACVRRWNCEEITDLFRLRASQEGLAARLCAERADSAELAAIHSSDEAFRRSIETHDPDANIQADVGFHLAVVRGAHFPDLERIIENLSIMQCSMKAFGASLGIPRLMSRDYIDLHTPIIQAIEKRNPDAAEEAARSHVEGSLQRNLAWVKEMGSRPTR